jgi:hypothetical protein
MLRRAMAATDLDRTERLAQSITENRRKVSALVMIVEELSAQT